MADNRQHVRGDQRGSTLLMAVASLLLLLAMAGFAIDALTLYVARTDAQRAADAAALAGAKVFVASGCTTSANCTSGTTQTLVQQQAQGAGAQNKVFGQPASIAPADVTFPPSPTSDPHDPMVEVKVHRVIPTLFIGALSKMLGGNTSGISVAATATAEAFNGTGGSTPFATSCVKPWMMPNCDPAPGHTLPANPNCGPGYGYFVQGNPAQIVHPGYYNGGNGGVIGEPWLLHFGVGPSQYGEISFTGANNSGNVYRNEIQGCAPEAALACGDTVFTNVGQATGPTKQGTDALINGPNGQDQIDTSSPPPFNISAGTGNTFYPPGTQWISSSNSIVTVPVYDTPGGLCPGNSCGNTQTVVGFMQLFIQGMSSQADVNAVILNVVACPPAGGPGGGSGTPPVGTTSPTLVPVRLVRNP
jgi:hypothetical protein